ncbi:T9SS type A sorting domain-containing protein [bacterium]|nr:T9SS type A sorting domain-containing protein [bacterium]
MADPTGFQTALDNAADNGENDTIIVSSGTYDIPYTLMYSSIEDNSLTIIGSDDDSVIIAGSLSVRVLELLSDGSDAGLKVMNLTCINGNRAYGGGLYIETTTSPIILDNCNFNNCTASAVGGGVNAYSNSGSISVANCSFTGNTGGRAAGLFVQSETGSYIGLTNSTFRNNVAEVDGGATMLYPLGYGVAMVVEDNYFEENNAGEFGGGCWARLPAGNSTIDYHNNRFYNNATTSAGDGGGSYIEMESGSLFYSDNYYQNNNSVWDGGGVWIHCVSGTLQIAYNDYILNSAGSNGGGISVGLDYGSIVFERNILTQNTANTGGGLNIAAFEAALSVFHNTFYSNAALDGSGICFYFDDSSASADVYNNILWQDISPAIAMSGATSTTARYSDIEYGTGEPWFGVGCIDADPLFSNPAICDFNLTWYNYPVDDATKSPCIDSGDPASPYDPDSTIADMGALYFDHATRIPENCVKTLDEYKISCYPNPFNAVLNIQIAAKMGEFEPPMSIGIYDINGKLVKHWSIDKPVYRRTSHSQSEEPESSQCLCWNPDRNSGSGIYVVRITDGSKFISNTIVYLK